jgi:hypothetical protein
MASEQQNSRPLTSQRTGIVAHPSWWKRQIRTHAYVWETLILVLFFAAINLGAFPAQPGFLGIEPNPYWIVVLLMAGRYGFRAGLFSSLLCSATFCTIVATKLNLLTIRDLTLFAYAKNPVLFITVGVIVGMLVQRLRDRQAKTEERLAALRQQHREIQQKQDELSDVNEELANRVINATDTLPILYKYAKKLNSLDHDEVYVALTELVVEIIKAERVSVYAFHDDIALLHSRNGHREEGAAFPLNDYLRQKLLDERRPVSLRDLADAGVENPGLKLCGPLGPTNGDIDAILVVDELDFMRFNPAAIRLFEVVINWAADCLQRVGQYSELPSEYRRQQNLAALNSADPEAGRIKRDTSPTEMQTSMGESMKVPQMDSAHEDALLDSNTIAQDVDPPSAGLRMLGKTPASKLHDLLNQADSEIESYGTEGAQPSQQVVVDLGSMPHAPAMRSMLTRELQAADHRGNASLTRLLAEIDHYVVSQGNEPKGK